MKRALTIIVLFLISTIAYTHEFWLEPSSFIFKINDTAHVQLMVGEDYTGSHVTMSKGRIVKLTHYFNSNEQDIAENFPFDSISKVEVKLESSGNHLIAFNSNNRSIQLEAAKFNDYLRSEGLEHIARLRAAKNDTMKSGREVYQRCVKTLLQVGGRLDSTYAINTGMPLEIIPFSNPYGIKKKGTEWFKILFKHKPLQNSLVLAWHTQNGKTTHVTARSDAKGNVKFPIINNGKWMISVVHMIPYEDPKLADWQSFWSSYTFGYN